MTEQTIFLSALDIADPAERTAYLDRACGGDAALRQQVEALLAAHDRSGLFLNEPALEQLAAGWAGTRCSKCAAMAGSGPSCGHLTNDCTGSWPSRCSPRNWPRAGRPGSG